MPPRLNTIKVIHATSIGVSASPKRGILSITPQQESEVVDLPGRSPSQVRRR